MVQMMVQKANRVIMQLGVTPRYLDPRCHEALYEVHVGVNEVVAPPVLMATVRTKDGKERHVEVRPFVEEKLGNLPKGKSVVLLLDDENKVTDVAVLPESQR